MIDRNINDKKQLIYDLEKYLNKIIFIKFVGGREVIGKLMGFDSVQNIVLSNIGSKNKTWTYGKYLICFSNSIISIGLGIPQSGRLMQ